MEVKIKSGETIVFIGDSITDSGRRGAARPLGAGYVKLFSDLVTVREPGKKINIINKGTDCETILDLQKRWDDDVIYNQPHWLSVKIGINDLYRFLNKTPKSVSPDEFLTAYDNILSRTKEMFPQCGILLIEPFYVSNCNSDMSFRKVVLDTLPEYIQTVRKMNRKYDTRLIKTHDLFQKQLKYNDTDVFSSDAIHPNLTGHLLIAEAVYKVLSE